MFNYTSFCSPSFQSIHSTFEYVYIHGDVIVTSSLHALSIMLHCGSTNWAWTNSLYVHFHIGFYFSMNCVIKKLCIWKIRGRRRKKKKKKNNLLSLSLCGLNQVGWLSHTNFDWILWSMNKIKIRMQGLLITIINHHHSLNRGKYLHIWFIT